MRQHGRNPIVPRSAGLTEKQLTLKRPFSSFPHCTQELLQTSAAVLELLAHSRNAFMLFYESICNMRSSREQILVKLHSELAWSGKCPSKEDRQVLRKIRQQNALWHSTGMMSVHRITMNSDVRSKLTNNFISEISLSTSSINCIMKSTSLCFSISSVWKLVTRKEMS